MRLCIAVPARNALLALFLLFAVPAAQGMDDSTRVRPDVLDTVWKDAGIVWEDGIAWLLAPLSFSDNDWLLTGGIGAATIGVYTADGDIRAIMRRNQNSGWYDAASVANEGGRVFWAQTLTGALYLPGLVFGIDELRVTGRMLGQTLMYSGAVTMAVRIILGRDRPYAELGPRSFGWMELGNAEQAMPSGHTTVAFSIASILSRRIRHPAATVLLYLAATATGMARMYHDQHWASDVLLGAVIGHTAGMYVAAREEARDQGKGDESKTWSVLPSPGGVVLQYRF
ncbi:MAG: phosphatase PAP2 family protein [Bacteroidia bacterium]|nr:phosphatase PAP2 family protein [Bacteroidia bacterium]